MLPFPLRQAQGEREKLDSIPKPFVLSSVEARTCMGTVELKLVLPES